MKPAKPKPRLDPSSLSTNEAAVYESFLGLKSDPQRSLNVSSKTFPLDLSFPSGSNGCVDDLRLEDASNARGHFHVLTVGMIPPVWRNFRIVNADEQNKIIDQNDPIRTIPQSKSVDEAVRDAYSSGLLSLSEIVFDKAHKHAVMQYRFDCGSLCGNGATLVFEKIGEEWKRTRTCGQWIS
jgi:hypothetical protein